MIVADTGPIIAFARIGRLDLLRQVLGELVVPPAVYDDLVGKGKGRSGAQEVERAEWIRRATIGDMTTLAQLPPELGEGEREAIVLAEEQGARFFVDDRKARDVATRFGIKVFGSLGVLAEAKRRGLIAEVRPIIEELLAIGYWMHGERVVRPFLREIGEAPE